MSRSTLHIDQNLSSQAFEDGITRVDCHADKLGWPQHPIGCPDGIKLIAGETGEARAYRRYPINSHKQGPAE